MITGARILYQCVPRCVGLRRITLHKSVSAGDKLYTLMCECSSFMDHLQEAAYIAPALRARLCGYWSIYRVADVLTEEMCSTTKPYTTTTAKKDPILLQFF
ncbi:hypothetical protein OUZ56_004241 [Daphnia magna]|uniref:DUF7153 domain-containing protein n=1 Tax=Daphnia magna TaxID=35525 RepID=A0ABQ9YP64_9CRUS|nr:hypothetical protein OUZ56_004241 [Daphnia magna]